LNNCGFGNAKKIKLLIIMMVNINRFVKILLVLSSFYASTVAFWRLPCRGRAGLGRIDPLVDTGRIADHAHTIHGGNSARSSFRLLCA